MTQALLRTHLNSSSLVRFLAGLAVAQGGESRQSFAQRLGQWIHFTDAATLFAALDAGATRTPTPLTFAQRETTTAVLLALGDELARVQTSLANFISHSCMAAPGASRITFPVPRSDAPYEIATAYSPFHRFCQTLQKEMDAKLVPLRVAVRSALTKTTPALKQLAALDAALDAVLQDRESRLLGTVPRLLQKRFEHLLQAHQQTLKCNGQTDDPATWMRPGGWLTVFRDEIRTALLAELDLRLQPTMGLLDALGKEVNGQA